MPSNYLKLAQSAGKIVGTRCDYFWFCMPLVEKLARVCVSWLAKNIARYISRYILRVTYISRYILRVTFWSQSEHWCIFPALSADCMYLLCVVFSSSHRLCLLWSLRSIAFFLGSNEKFSFYLCLFPTNRWNPARHGGRHCPNETMVRDFVTHWRSETCPLIRDVIYLFTKSALSFPFFFALVGNMEIPREKNAFPFPSYPRGVISFFSRSPNC